MPDLKVERSRYRQVQLTITQQSSGRLDYSVKAKGLAQAWDERTTILRSSVPAPFVPITSTEDALRVVLSVLGESMLPVRE